MRKRALLLSITAAGIAGAAALESVWTNAVPYRL